jgi:hypothetical protein
VVISLDIEAACFTLPLERQSHKAGSGKKVYHADPRRSTVDRDRALGAIGQFETISAQGQIDVGCGGDLDLAYYNNA